MTLGRPNQLGRTDRLCETLVSWRSLLGAFRLGPVTGHERTTSEEPPLSNFNSYRDILARLPMDWHYSVQQ